MSSLSGFGRLYRGETTVDYYGKRKAAFIVSGAFMVVTLVTLIVGGLNLGIDFKGGVAWEVPASTTFGEAQVREVLDANNVETVNAKIQVLSGTEGERIRVQVGDQPEPAAVALKFLPVQAAAGTRIEVGHGMAPERPKAG